MATTVKIATPLEWRKPKSLAPEFEAKLLVLERHALRLSGIIADPSKIAASAQPNRRVTMYG